MPAKKMIVTAMLVASVLALGGESFARGGGAGGGGGRGQMGSSVSQPQGQVRPDDSQRRDGTFLSTGSTASGSTTRPSNGQGVMDGTGINDPQNTTP